MRSPDGNKIPVVHFREGQLKDDIAAEHRNRFTKTEGVLFIGKVQEKTPVFRTERRRSEKTGATYPWPVRSTAMVNQFYVYCLDRDFGPFFLKFSTYFPYNAKLCLNGHEYAKRQLMQKGIDFEALDNGVLRCDDRNGCRQSAMDSARKRLMLCYANGSVNSLIHLQRPIARLVIVIRSQFCRPSSP